MPIDKLVLGSDPASSGSVSTDVQGVMVGTFLNGSRTPALLLNNGLYTNANIDTFNVESNSNYIPFDVSDFVNGAWVIFNVTVMNNGKSTLSLTNFTLDTYSINSAGAYVKTIQPISPNTTFPMSDLYTTPPTIDGFVKYMEPLVTSAPYYNDSWDFAMSSMNEPPTSLAPGGTFTYQAFFGLGDLVPTDYAQGVFVAYYLGLAPAS
ncbi:hypothetical protein OXIME_000642 [Oxyplasma meridianum]|uniref:DUF4352 domain-containing protein n=1 Tax=Oxyplasma meridianum TaxID=3073602 RepID=A0AAX4NFN7_9ARCH